MNGKMHKTKIGIRKVEKPVYSNTGKNIWLIIFSVAGVYFFSSSVYADETFKIAAPNREAIVVTINEQRLKDIESDPNKINSIISENNDGMACAPPQVRISRCAWSCADQSTRIISCESRLNRILERIFGR